MSCPSFEEKIARYAGGDLEPAEIRTVEGHLRQCAACAELARLLEQDRAWLGSRPPEAADMDYAAMRSQIRRAIVHRRGARRWAWALAAAAAVLLATGVGMTRRAPRETVTVAGVRTGAAQEAMTGPTVAEDVPAVQPAPARVPARHAGVRAPRNGGEDITLEDAMRMLAELEPPEMPEGSDSPVEMRIVTRDPNVTITVVQETKGGSL